MEAPSRLENLSTQKKVLFELLRKKRQQEKTLQPQVIARAGERETYPLSFAQQRLWFINQLEPGHPIYNIPAAVRLAGPLDINALGRTLSEVVRRHEVLRTTFMNVDDRPVQRIEPASPVILSPEDLSYLPVDEREAEARRMASEEANLGFDLAQGLPLRVRLLRLNAEDHVLLFTMHHIAGDAWSTGILIKEVARLYEAYTKNEPSPLDELPIQYADYAVWQQEYLQGEVLEKELQYWKRQLEGVPPALGLPTDRPRPAIQTYRSATHLMKVSPDLMAQLKQVARQEEATLFMLLLAAFKVLLHRHTNQRDIVVGTPIAGRTRAEMENLIGFFINALALRTKIDEEGSFSDLLNRVRETCLGAYAHQETPLEKLVEELNPERVLSHAPVFQVTFDLQSMHRETLELKGLTLSPLKIGDRATRMDLGLNIIEQENGLFFFAHYNKDLFDAGTIERMMGHFHFLLESISTDTKQIVRELPLLNPAELRQILTEWNNTERDFPQNDCLHHLFERRVALSPKSIAIRSGTETMSYGELNRRANQLAHYLRKLGVGPETLVGISTNRGAEMIVGILGILKAGGAYLPLDSVYPLDRLAYMLSDAAAAVLLTQEDLIEHLPSQWGQLVCLDADWEKIAVESAENPQVGISSRNLAYVIYTSGSTGQPKGSLLEHRGVCNLAQAQIEFLEIDSTSRVLQFASLSFDASVWEIFATLLAGATLCLAEPSSLIPGPEMLRLLRDEAITVATLPPSVLAALPSGELPALRTLAVAGENCTSELITRWANGRRFINAYGPTEATVCAAFCDQVDKDHPSVIGVPISNTEVYILDEHLRTAPIGVAGQICLAGVGLARGYLNRPELTAEKFIPHPYSQEPRARLYCTGDLARYRRDGKIEFLGRIDQQVKIRGFRIEPGEIEAALDAHPAVRQSRIRIDDTANGDKRLIAYIIPETEQSSMPQLMGEVLVDYLKTRLPQYMVPVSYVFLPSFPLSPNGKVDYSLLPSPELEETVNDAAEQSPQTPIEELLAGIWAHILGRKSVGIEDDFFELGGHSLLATQVVSRMCEAFQVELSLRSLFEARTVAEMAKLIEASLNDLHQMEVPPIVPVLRSGPMQLSFAQQRLWFVDQYEPGGAFYNISVAVRLRGHLNIETLGRTLNEVVRRHEVLRTSFIQIDGEPWQVISTDLSLALPVTELDDLPEAEREAEAKRIARAEALRPFDLAAGQLLRVRLLRLGAEDHIAVFTVHHIVCDGWSMSILVQEISALYAVFTNNETSPLPELPIQYGDFAHWQRHWLQGEVLQSQLRYWTEQWERTPVALELPTDRPRPATQTFHGSSRSLMLPQSLSESLRELSNLEGCTLFMTLLAAFQTMLRCYSASDDIVVGTDVANRNRGEIEGLIGFFVNQLVMRTDLSGNLSFQELLARVREMALGAYAHQDLPFDKLVEAINPERDLSRTPLFQVKLLLQNTPRETLKLPELALSRFEFESGISRFDLVLSLTDSPNGLLALIGYNTDLFESATIDRMLGHLQALLQQVVAGPELCLSQLSLLTTHEQRQALIEWNHTHRPYPDDLCLHQLFEAQSERTPEAVAVLFEDEQINYRQLDLRANQVAHYLRSLGVGPGVPVGLCLERSIEMVVGLLGVMKAGGACLPMDPAYPLSRLAYVIEDGQVPVLLTQERLVEKLPAHWGQVVSMDTDLVRIAGYGSQRPDSGATADGLAYVIYTSGSTGDPKGVMVSHRSLVHRVLSMIENYGLDSTSRMLNFVSLGFDALIEEIFPLLACGGGMVMLRNPGQMHPRDLLRECEGRGVNSLHLPPAYWYEIAEELAASGEAAPGWIRLFITGGENTSISKLLMWAGLNRHPSKFINAYGPTETAVTATIFEVPLDSPELSDLVRLPAGRPIANTQIYILNQEQQLLPIGVIGELYIGGVGVAWGYRNKPELTAERFVPDSFGHTGARLYRTGDLARYLPDGKIEIMGRIDGQVKIRGYRIETGEIAVVLERHPQIEKAWVTVYADVRGETRLVAYLLPRAAASPDPADVRSFIRGMLPEYMIPSSITILEELPLTPHGKIDYRRLPAPAEQEQSAAARSDGPRTEIERTLCAIWQSVMNLDQVGVQTNFFDLGGNSLLAIKVMARVREVFHVELPVRALFESLTIANFSELIKKEMKAGHLTPTIPIKKVPREHRLPLSFAQQRLWFIDQLEPGLPIYNCPGAFRLSGPLQIETLEKSLSEIVRRHEILRTTFAVEQGQPWQVINPPQRITLPVIDLCSLPEDEREREINRLAAEEARRPFDLAAGPMLRVTMLRLGPEEHIALFTMHHVAGDGWSILLLFREVVSICEAFADNQPSPLPELPVQYADFAYWQQEWLKQGGLEAELGYWRRQLSGKLPVLRLPFARNRQAATTYHGARFAFELPSNLSQRLKDFSRREEATLFMTLLAAFKILLYRYTQLEDIIVGTAHAGRNRIETENLIGLFINMLVLRTDLSGNPTFRELLHRVREVTLGAYAHQDVPFERLVEEFHTEKRSEHSPIFQIAFGLENLSQLSLDDSALATPQRLSELTITPQKFELETIRYDLTLWIKDGGDKLYGWWNYSTDVFDAATIARMQGQFETLLQGVLEHPDACLDDLELLTTAEKHRRAQDEENAEETGYLKFTNVQPRSIKVSEVSQTFNAEDVYCAD